MFVGQFDTPPIFLSVSYRGRCQLKGALSVEEDVVSWDVVSWNVVSWDVVSHKGSCQLKERCHLKGMLSVATLYSLLYSSISAIYVKLLIYRTIIGSIIMQ